MNQPVCETARSPTSLPTPSSSASTRQDTQQWTDQGEALGINQPDTSKHQTSSPSPVTQQPVAQIQFDRGKPTGVSTSMPDDTVTHRVTSNSSRQVTVESAEPSPRMTPAGFDQDQFVTSAQETFTPLMTPFGTPVGPTPTTPAEVESLPWRTPPETLKDEQSISPDGEWSLDFRPVPILQVVTPPVLDQQESYGSPVSSMGRWWWPGNPFVTSSSFLKK